MLGLEKLFTEGAYSDVEAHCGMYEMLRMNSDLTQLADRGESCPIGKGMNLVGWVADQPAWDYKKTSPPAYPSLHTTMPLAVSKIGWYKPDYSNVLLIRTKPPNGNTTILAVLVAINNNPADFNDKACKGFGEAMASELKKLHP